MFILKVTINKNQSRFLTIIIYKTYRINSCFTKQTILYNLKCNNSDYLVILKRREAKRRDMSKIKTVSKKKNNKIKKSSFYSD